MAASLTRFGDVIIVLLVGEEAVPEDLHYIHSVIWASCTSPATL